MSVELILYLIDFLKSFKTFLTILIVSFGLTFIICSIIGIIEKQDKVLKHFYKDKPEFSDDKF
jgi:hypothetical protein